MMGTALYCDKREYREDVYDSEVLPGKQWTPWIEIIKPIKPEVSNGWIEKKENWYTNLAGLKELIEGEIGIYELRLQKGEEDTCVVYIGSSCAECGLCDRLSQYATDGSHKALLIQTALSAGATIEASACTLKDCKTAHACENEILAKFDYLWKIRNNLTPRKQKASVTALYGMIPEVFSTREVTAPQDGGGGQRKRREKVKDSEVLPETWTLWTIIITPEESKGWIMKRENWYTNLAGLKQFVGKNDIYELRLKKEKNTVVVYIGSSCAKGGLCARLSQYARNGSHKALLIQKALSAGARIEARTCTLKDCETARARENEILAKLDYLWNIRSNMTPRKEEASATALYGMTVYQPEPPAV